MHFSLQIDITSNELFESAALVFKASSAIILLLSKLAIPCIDSLLLLDNDITIIEWPLYYQSGPI